MNPKASEKGHGAQSAIHLMLDAMGPQQQNGATVFSSHVTMKAREKLSSICFYNSRG